MILYQGKLYPSREQERLLKTLEGDVLTALAAPTPGPEAVIAACDALAGEVLAGRYDAEIQGLDLDPALRTAQVRAAAALLGRESLTAKFCQELGEGPFAPRWTASPGGAPGFWRRRAPLGVLLHIAAGNVDGLPAYSAVEGLLAGNVNILKLPAGDNGLSVRLLQALTDRAPALAERLFVFDTPSTDLGAMEAMARLADGIAVWGGEGAVSALRRLAPPGARLIEWGHRLGFCYVTPAALASPAGEAGLTALAGHVAETKQLLCSSLQTVFLDTEDFAQVEALAERFLPLLERAMAKYPVRDLGALGQRALRRQTERLERWAGHPQDREKRLGRGCEVVLCRDRELECSDQFGSVLLKALPRKELLPALRRSRGRLQTGGLLCTEEERPGLTGTLLSAGVVRVTGPGDMSRTTALDAHDGQSPLERYTRIVEYL